MSGKVSRIWIIGFVAIAFFVIITMFFYSINDNDAIGALQAADAQDPGLLTMPLALSVFISTMPAVWVIAGLIYFAFRINRH